MNSSFNIPCTFFSLLLHFTLTNVLSIYTHKRAAHVFRNSSNHGILLLHDPSKWCWKWRSAGKRSLRERCQHCRWDIVIHAYDCIIWRRDQGCYEVWGSFGGGRECSYPSEQETRTWDRFSLGVFCVSWVLFILNALWITASALLI